MVPSAIATQQPTTFLFPQCFSYKVKASMIEHLQFEFPCKLFDVYVLAILLLCVFHPLGACHAGYWCREGASSPSPLDGLSGLLCPPGHYCPPGVHLGPSFRLTQLILDTKSTLFLSPIVLFNLSLFRAACNTGSRGVQ